MTKKDIYVVIGRSGDYEDTLTWNACAFFNGMIACDFANEFNERWLKWFDMNCGFDKKSIREYLGDEFFDVGSCAFYCESAVGYSVERTILYDS